MYMDTVTGVLCYCFAQLVAPMSPCPLLGVLGSASPAGFLHLCWVLTAEPSAQSHSWSASGQPCLSVLPPNTFSTWIGEAESAFEPLSLPERVLAKCAGRKARGTEDGSFLIQVLPRISLQQRNASQIVSNILGPPLEHLKYFVL